MHATILGIPPTMLSRPVPLSAFLRSVMRNAASGRTRRWGGLLSATMRASVGDNSRAQSARILGQVFICLPPGTHYVSVQHGAPTPPLAPMNWLCAVSRPLSGKRSANFQVRENKGEDEVRPH